MYLHISDSIAVRVFNTRSYGCNILFIRILMKNRSVKLRLLLKRFLIEQKAHKQWVENRKAFLHRRSSNIDFADNLALYFAGVDLIERSFIWRNTIEGYEYWDNLDELWKMYFKNHRTDYEYE